MRQLLNILILLGVGMNGHAASVKFQFYGTDLNVNAKTNGFPSIEFDTANVKKIMLDIDKEDFFVNTIRDCQALKEKLHLNDWGYFVMLEDFSNSYANKYTKSPELSKLIMTYLCIKSGYDIVWGLTSDNKIALFYTAEGFVLNTPYITNKDKTYFYYQRKGKQNGAQLGQMLIKSMNLGNKKVDFTLLTLPLLHQDMTDTIIHKTNFLKGWDIKIRVNKNLINFYKDYPISIGEKNFITKFTKLAESPLSQEVKAQIYPKIKTLMSGQDQLTNVNNLLHWIQYGFEYMLDEKVWGGDRPFFPEETLYYPYCDSEDRACLFARLVTDLLGLKTICLYSKKIYHLTIGIHFTDQEVEGESYMYDGEKYIICDPTYYGANAGKVLKKWETTEVGPIVR